ncbi:4-hydroxybenzoate octaprenyltransferase [Candidatus Tokpelaia sp.]|uniref:4-hydroxybenzoate octaprenyltransferase n=1 Tax=Candidatus Tokpelaia sp. TaxID=2233777 RepID=UPI001239125F|nr:4-hydroxybenzoate octaprenyltransferase [Candidatus Tokpelaia sp.]KAA6406138.1 4-hydroxybenzoate octaprenyltransferase [Candidatus Tokpelaia sp.]
MAKTEASDLQSGYWLYRFLPPKAAAYAQLARLDRPIGWQLLFWPCIWGLVLAFYAQNLFLLQSAFPVWPAADFLPVAIAHYHAFSPPGFLLFTALLFLIGAVVMRGAGCTYNDIVDHKIDAQVARTKTRPLPSGRVSRGEALAFMLVQSLLGLLVLLQLPLKAVLLGLCSLFIVALYPFVKRISHWPQAVLGLSFNWGALLGFAAIAQAVSWPSLLLYGGAVCWTIGYDTIYAHQDREDDALIGVHSTARLFGAQTRAALLVFYILAAAGLAGAFWLAGAGLWAFAGIAAAAACLLWQIRRFDMNNAALCLKLFKSNNLVGLLVALPACIGLVCGRIC